MRIAVRNVQDNEASDSEDEEERWRRKPFRFTTAAAARRAARHKEAQEDESDRMKELEEVAAAHLHNGGRVDAREVRGEPLGVIEKSVQMVEPKKEAKLALNPNDGIMKVCKNPHLCNSMLFRNVREA